MIKFSKRRKFVNHKKRIMYFSLFFIILFISVGYAYLNSTLSITGHTEIGANTWNIHFENLSIATGSVNASTPAAIQSNTTSINYSVELGMPGDFYEFEVDVVNSGTLPGKISLTNIQGISSAAEPYLDQSIKYTNGNPVQVDDLLNPGARKRIVVRVAYKDDLSSLPSENIELDLIYNITYVQSDEEEEILSPFLQQLVSENPSCMTKYEGDVTDQVGQTVQAHNVYFNKCADKRNIIFNNMCWQMIRTTETGGIKMIYNGDVVDGKCESTRENHKGIVGEMGSSENLSDSYLYGDSFTYDTSNNEFTLTNTTTATWSGSTYENLLGKFTCKNTTGTCTTLYNVNGYSSNTTAYISSYTIGNTNYAQIGISPFNANYRSPAMVGYKYNKVYHFQRKQPGTTYYKYGNSFTYNSNTHTYTLSGTTKTINNWTTGYTQLNNTHYTCWNTDGSCATISYVYYTNETDAVYFDITGGKSVGDVLVEMLSENDVNYYNSTIKGYIDAWYEHNLTSYTNKIEDTVYCNDRTILDLAALNPNGGDTVLNFWMTFKNYNQTTSLVCSSLTDQFAVSNNKAKLTYPIALITTEELSNLNSPSLRVTGYWYHNLTPNYYASAAGFDYVVDEDGTISYVSTEKSGGVRPAISISSDAVIASGTGSEADPWVVQE